ncbi:MAG: glycosyltransferase family 4 protein [Verrucomicrobiota bacterium]
MRIVQITTDNRLYYKTYGEPEPHFGTAPEGLLEGFRMIDGVEVHVISCSPVRMTVPARLGTNIHFHQPYVSKLGWGRTLFAGCILSVRRLLKSIRPDIVHGQGTERECALAAVLSGFPNVLTIHGNMRVHASRPENKGNNYYRMAAALESFALKRTGGVVAISQYTADLVAPFVRKSWLLPNAVDRRFFDLQGTKPEIPRLLFVGSLDERKNPLGLLQSCEELLRAGTCTLALAGNLRDDTVYSRAVLDLAASMPGVTLLGFLDRDALAAEFEKSSLLVLPTFEDNCPMVVLEAMAAGIPVAASRVGGIPDLVEDSVTGLLFNPEANEEIRSAIRRLVMDPAMRIRMGEAGSNAAMARFHPERIARQHLEIYQEALRG